MTRAPDKAQVARAFELADDSMREQLQAHCQPAAHLAGLTGCFYPCGADGKAVHRLDEAEPPVVEAFTWLYDRGQARIVSDRNGHQIIVLTKGA
jgi:hypothetical protein